MVPGASSPRHSMGGLRRGAAWPRSSYRVPFDGSDQQLYGMDDRDVQAARTSALSDLHETAGIPRRDNGGPRLRDPRQLELQELARDRGLEDAVHPRASAAEVALRELHEPEAGDPPEELPRLLTHALAVGEVAGVVIGHGHLEPAERQLGVREHLRHVARPHGESPRLPHPVTVLLHRRAAPRCVGHDPVDVDWVVTNAAGCGSTMKEYGHWVREARGLAVRTRDVTEMLADAELPLGRLEVTVTYHDACHLAHGQRVRQEPRQLLRRIPGLRLVELAESDLCCGSAGVYSILEPAIARELLELKLTRIAETGATVVATGNPGCLMQIAQGARARGLDVTVVHPVELLVRSIEGDAI